MNTKLILWSLILIPRVTLASPEVFCPCEDRQIVAQLQASANADIEVAQAVLPRLHDQKAIAYAQAVIADQTNFVQQIDKFVNDTGLVPDQTDLSKAYGENAKVKTKTLGSLKGTSLDSAYIDTQVNDHLSLITAYETYWILKVLNADLKAFLEKARPSIQSHYDQAKAIQDELKSIALTTP